MTGVVYNIDDTCHIVKSLISQFSCSLLIRISQTIRLFLGIDNNVKKMPLGHFDWGGLNLGETLIFYAALIYRNLFLVFSFLSQHFFQLLLGPWLRGS